MFEYILSTPPAESQIYGLLKNSIKDTAQNREILLWGDPVPISFALQTAYTVSQGMKPKSSNKQAIEIINGFNDRINHGNQTIEDAFTHSYTDMCSQYGSYWRILHDNDMEYKIDLARLDPLTLTRRKESRKGWEAIVQRGVEDVHRFYSKEAFYAHLKENASQVGFGGYGMDDHEEGYHMSTERLVVIPNEPDILLEFEFFKRPLIAPVLDYLLYKRWILWFMRNYSERFWSPNRIGFVGDPQGGMMPNDPEEMKKQRDDLLGGLVQLRAFGAMATAGYNRVEELGKNTAKSSQVYVDFINLLDKQTMYSLGGSMGQRDASGNELATSRILQEGWLRFVLGIRSRYARRLKRFYRNVLLPANGIRLPYKDLKLVFSPINLTETLDLVRAIREAQDGILFENVNEPRAILAEIWEQIDEVDSTAANRMKNDYMELYKKNVPQSNQAFA
ncbi:MAG: hypothetical protein BV459_01520 [Thermoplasmata archaeon M11B2D]|nr:MAG: hypothetical protein BV459_01520 [Thermoplasmata archaeon M11B2D]